MSACYLGVDVGATKTHALLVDDAGRIIGESRTQGANPTQVGYAAFGAVVFDAMDAALRQTRLAHTAIAASGFGIAGLDWPSQHPPTRDALNTLNLTGPMAIVNDAMLGILAHEQRGWGISLVAGTGCNCWGRDAQGRIGRVTGDGDIAGEYAGASELVARAVHRMAHEWTGRGPATQLTPAFVDYAGVASLDALIEGISTRQVELTAEAAPLIFACARAGDAVALDLLRWAASELGELVLTVAAQLDLRHTAHDVILVGSLFKGTPSLQAMLDAYLATRLPDARCIRLTVPPVVGAVRLAMEQAGCAESAISAVMAQLHTHGVTT